MKIVKFISITLLILLYHTNSEATEWTAENTKWESAYIVTHLIDWGQTLEIARNPKYTELNPLLGNYPSEADVNKYFIISGIGHYLISKYLDKHRLTWQRATFFMEFGIVTRNASIGIKFNF